MTIRRLTQKLENLMLQLHNITGLERFILHGGAPTDLMIGTTNLTKDLDIAASIDETDVNAYRKRVVGAGFNLTIPARQYYVYINMPVTIVVAEKLDTILDAAFFERPDLIGQFSAETLYCRYPELDCMDNFDALGAISRKTLVAVRGFDAENPFLLTGRFLYLCAKYEMSLQSSAHKDIAANLERRIYGWHPSNEFQGKEAHNSCISSIFKSILAAQNRSDFCAELVETGLIDAVFLELQKAMARLCFDQKSARLQELKTKSDLVKLLSKYLSRAELVSFNSVLADMGSRIWERQDVAIAKECG